MTAQSNGVHRGLLGEPAERVSEWQGTPEAEWEGGTGYEQSFGQSTFLGEWQGEASAGAPAGEGAGYENGLSPEWETAWETDSVREWESIPEGPGYETQSAAFEWEGLPEDGGGFRESSLPSPAGSWETAAGTAFEYGQPELEWEAGLYGEAELYGEADPFVPVAMVAAQGLPIAMKLGRALAARLAPQAGKVAGRVLRSLLAGRRRRSPGRPAAPPSPVVPQDLLALLRRLNGVVGEGELLAEHTERTSFGEFETDQEIPATASAHEIALTEILGAEASHAETLGEAQTFCAAALPLTLTIMPARRLTRPYTPALVDATSRLVRGLHTGGPATRDFVRLAPTIQRRTIGSLAARAQAGRPLPQSLVAPLMAAHTRRLLASRRDVATALGRNMALRRVTVARPGERPRPGLR